MIQMSSFSIPVKRKVKQVELISQKITWEDFSIPLKNVSKITKQEDEFSESVEEKKDYFSDEILKEVKEEAYSRGLNEGKKEGYDSGKEAGISEIEPKSRVLENLIKVLKDGKESFYQENELFIVKLAIEISKKIIHRELKQSPEILIYVVREALRRVANSGHILVKVNPEDLKLFQALDKEVGDQVSAFESVDFISAEEIQRGGCTIESEVGIVDAQLDVQLEKIEQMLIGDMDD